MKAATSVSSFRAVETDEALPDPEFGGQRFQLGPRRPVADQVQLEIVALLRKFFHGAQHAGDILAGVEPGNVQDDLFAALAFFPVRGEPPGVDHVGDDVVFVFQAVAAHGVLRRQRRDRHRTGLPDQQPGEELAEKAVVGAGFGKISRPVLGEDAGRSARAGQYIGDLAQRRVDLEVQDVGGAEILADGPQPEPAQAVVADEVGQLGQPRDPRPGR